MECTAHILGRDEEPPLFTSRRGGLQSGVNHCRLGPRNDHAAIRIRQGWLYPDYQVSEHRLALWATYSMYM